MKTKSPTIKIQQKDGSVSANLMAFLPNLRSGRHRGYAIVSNDGSIFANENSIHPDETGKYLYINELALPLSARVPLHKQSREKNNKPLIFDERAAPVPLLYPKLLPPYPMYNMINSCKNASAYDYISPLSDYIPVLFNNPKGNSKKLVQRWKMLPDSPAP